MNETIIFQAACKLRDQDRLDYLDEACGANVELRRELDELLAAHDRVGPFLQKPAVDPRVDDAALTQQQAGTTAADPLLGTLFAGRYKIRERLGEGGMGTVYVADQIEPVQRRVALKLIKGDFATPSALARFDQERQALALMDHPNIAKVFDAGIATPERRDVSPSVDTGEHRRAYAAPLQGTPYFVMELIKGVPITKYCDEAKLTPKERLELFIPVCQAVQHAHQKGIIHRDLKPSNILIGLYDGKPVPKVIDFGIAKATGPKLTNQSVYTEVGSLIGTLEYMSPEQAELNNLDIDTRTDIYALGIILYELLTGMVPFSQKDFAHAGLVQMLMMIKEVEPTKPSTKLSKSGSLPSAAALRKLEPKKLTNLIKGDLDWIVMKALEKDRNRRYETANQFAQDIQCYLADKTTIASPPSAANRMRKWMRRNQMAVAVGTAVFFTVIGGAVTTEIQRYRAEREKTDKLAAYEDLQKEQEKTKAALVQSKANEEKARNQAQIAEAVREFLETDLIGQADPAQGTPDVELKLKTAIDRAVPQIAKRFEGKPLIEASIRRAIGNAYQGRGLYSQAIAQMERACELFRAEVAHMSPTDIQTLVLESYLESLLELIGLYQTQGQPQKALATLQTLEDFVRRSMGDSPEGKAMLETTTVSREILEGKKKPESLTKFTEEMTRKMGAKAPELAKDLMEVQKHVTNAWEPMDKYFAATKLMNQGKYPEAELALKQHIEAERAKEEPNMVHLFMVPLAEVYRLQAKNGEAKAGYETVRDATRKAYGEDHPILAGCQRGLALILLSEKKYAQAEIEIRAALTILEKQAFKDEGHFEVRSILGAILTGQKKYVEAEPLLLAGYHGLVQQEKANPEIRKDLLPAALDRLIEFYTQTNKSDEVKKWQSEKEKLTTLKP